MRIAEVRFQRKLERRASFGQNGHLSLGCPQTSQPSNLCDCTQALLYPDHHFTASPGMVSDFAGVWGFGWHHLHSHHDGSNITLMPWALCIEQELTQGRKRRALGQQEDSWLGELQTDQETCTNGLAGYTVVSQATQGRVWPPLPT